MPPNIYMFPFHDFVKKECTIAVIQQYITRNKKENTVHVFEGLITDTKLNLSILVSQKAGHKYIGLKTQLDSAALQCISKMLKLKREWTIFLIGNGRLVAFDPLQFYWYEFVRFIDMFLMGVDFTKKEGECCVCFSNDTEKLKKCPRCSAHYCIDCLSEKMFQCFSCNIPMKYNKKKNSIFSLSNNVIPTNTGCLLKILEWEFGYDTREMIDNFDAIQFVELLFDIIKREPRKKIGKYFHTKEFFNNIILIYKRPQS